jgi:hypothetical protein
MTALLLSLLSFAQDTTAQAALPLSGYVWATESLKPLRWPGSTVTVTEVAQDERVEVVLVDGGLVRIRKNLDFGWVPAASLTASDPTALEIPDLDLDLGEPGEVTLIDEEAPEPPAEGEVE